MSLPGPPDVQKLKAEGNLIALTEALGYKQGPSVHREAAKALREIGAQQAVEPLRVQFSSLYR